VVIEGPFRFLNRGLITERYATDPSVCSSVCLSRRHTHRLATVSEKVVIGLLFVKMLNDFSYMYFIFRVSSKFEIKYHYIKIYLHRKHVAKIR